jgi:hypothetical protein
MAGAERAWSVAFERGPVRDVRIGNLLTRSSAGLASATRTEYADLFRTVRPYKCARGNCIGQFLSHSNSIHLSFGTQRALGTWITVWKTPSRR